MMLRAFFCLAVLAAAGARGQIRIETQGGQVHLLPGDSAILWGNELRTDMTCVVKPVRPEIGFDLGFHSGYEVSLAAEELARSGGQLTVLFRVIPEGYPEKAAYFSQKWTVPRMAEEARGTAVLEGKFVLGEGKYQIDWLMRDRSERFCSAHWKVAAELRGKDRLIAPRLPQGTVVAQGAAPFAAEMPVRRDLANRFHVLVLFHATSQVPEASGMRATEVSVMLSILRSIAREPRINSYSIVAFNLERSAVLYRSEKVDELDFPALGKAINQVKLGTIDVRSLQRRHFAMSFFRELLAEEIATNRPNALIFVGPKTDVDDGVRSAWKELERPACPVFYLNYNADPVSNPLRDLIGSAVRLWKGFEYTISKPRDLFLAWKEVMSRIPVAEASADTSRQTETSNGLMPKK